MTTIIVPFVKGKDRPRFTGNGRTYTTKATKEAEEAIRAAYIEQENLCRGGYTAPSDRTETYTVVVEVHRALPKSRPKKVLSEPDVYKPDVDNIAKLVMDALNGVAYVDDCQVRELRVTKYPRVRGAEDRMVISVIKDFRKEPNGNRR